MARECWPTFIRGDRDWGTAANLARAEPASLDYLFKLRLTSGVKKLVERLMCGVDWCDASQDWQDAGAPLCLSGWSRGRWALAKYLHGCQLHPPALLPSPG